MAITLQSGVPCKIRSGDTITFVWSNPNYAPATHSAVLYMSRNGTAVAGITGTENGNEYTFTISKTVSAAYAPGTWTWMIRATVTADNTEETAESGAVTVLPNLAVNQTPSTAEAQLALVNAQINTLLTSGDVFQNVSFNGQSYSKQSIGGLFAIRDQLQAEVLREKRAAANAAGLNDGTNFVTRFVRS